MCARLYVCMCLGWQSHVNYISKKLCKGLFMLRVLKNYLPFESLISVYYAHIYSHLNYGILLWGNHASSIKLFILQKRAVRIMCGVSSRTQCRPLFIKTKILTLTSMFIYNCLLYIKLNLQQYSLCSSVHNYSTRGCSNIYIHKCKYTKTQNNFETVSLNLFNHLPVNIRNLPISLFKRTVRSTLISNPLYSLSEFFNISMF